MFLFILKAECDNQLFCCIMLGSIYNGKLTISCEHFSKCQEGHCNEKVECPVCECCHSNTSTTCPSGVDLRVDCPWHWTHT